MTGTPNSESPSATSHRSRAAIGAVKLSVAVVILAFLLYRLRGEELFVRLWNEPKHWGFLALAQTLVVAAISLNFLRWRLLVRSLGLPFSIRDALRLGSLGFLFNQVAPGSVGGDLFKAVAIAREHPGQRTEAVASVLIDRVVGMYAMLLVAVFGQSLAGAESIDHEAVRALKLAIAGLAIIGTVGIALLMTPAVTGPRIRETLARTPIIGETLARLVDAAAAYRYHRGKLFAAIGIACIGHTLFVLSFWLISRGLPVATQTLSSMFLIGPMSMCAGAIPLTPSGLGTMEAAMNALFEAFGAKPGDGLLVALAYRVMTYVMAGIGAVVYLSSRRQVSDVLHEAEAFP